MAKKNEKTEIKEYGVRKCSFSPAAYLIDIADKNGEVRKYLLVQDRVLWFQVYCTENNVVGVIDDSQIEFIEKLNLFKATCVVTVNGNIIGKSSGSCVFSGDTEKAIEMACTSAKGRALANAGFGTANCYGDNPEPIPCDAGIPAAPQLTNNPLVPNAPAVTKPTQKGSANTTAKKPAETPKQQPTPAPKAPEQDNTAPELPETLEDALKLVVTFRGQYYGQTLGEINGQNPDYIKFLATKYNSAKHPEYKKAAEIILANM